MKRLLIALLLLPGAASTLAQSFSRQSMNGKVSDLRYKYYGTDQGLSANFVYTVTQDHRGFMWIGTHDGLNSFDGYRFTVFRHDPSDSNSIPGNTVTDICTDRYDQIWLLADNKLCYLDTSRQRFVKVANVESSIPAHRIIMASDALLLVESARPKWVHTRTLQTGTIPFLHPAYGQGRWPNCKIRFARSSRGRTYAISNDGVSLKLFVLDTLRIAFRFVREHMLPDPSQGIRLINALMIDRDERVHLAFNTAEPAMLPVAPEKESLIMKESSYQVVDFLEDRNGDTWLATNWGLGYRKRATEHISWCRQRNIADGLRSDVIRDCFQDRTGIIWVATANGLHLFNPLQMKFRNLQAGSDAETALLSDFILGLQYSPEGKVRVDYFSADRYSLFDPVSRRLVHYQTARQDYRSVVVGKILRAGGKLPPDSTISSLAGMIQGPSAYPVHPIQGIFLNSRKEPWMFTQDRLVQLQSGAIHVLPAQLQDVKVLGDSVMLAMPGNGILIFDTRKARFMQSIRKGMLLSDDVTTLLVLPDGNFFAGTKGGGITFCDVKNHEFTHYTMNEGLATNSVYCMTRDKKGNIWIGTSRGVSCLEGDGSIRNFYPHHGFRNLEFNRHSACTLPDGTIFMGGMDGVDIFHPDSIKQGQQVPIVGLTDLKVFNASQGIKMNYVLQHDQNQVTFEFAVMDYAQPERNKFMYKLEGADQDWATLEGRNYVAYSYLNPGRYKFILRGADSEGNWSPDPLTLTLLIRPAWYQTWWFYGLVLAMVSLLVYLLFNYRLQQRLQVYHVRQRIHRDLHDDIGATLSSVKAYSEILKAYPDHPVIPDLISENAGEMIDQLDVIAWATDPQHDQLDSLKKRMVKFAAPLCHAKQIQFTLDVRGLSDTDIIPGEIRQQIYLVFKEAVNNLVKYSESTQCKVRLYVQSRFFVLEVEDNGKGVDGSILGNGNGWKNMKARADELGGQIGFVTEPGRGTCVVMQIPYPFRIPYSWGRKT